MRSGVRDRLPPSRAGLARRLAEPTHGSTHHPPPAGAGALGLASSGQRAGGWEETAPPARGGPRSPWGSRDRREDPAGRNATPLGVPRHACLLGRRLPARLRRPLHGPYRRWHWLEAESRVKPGLTATPRPGLPAREATTVRTPWGENGPDRSPWQPRSRRTREICRSPGLVPGVLAPGLGAR